MNQIRQQKFKYRDIRSTHKSQLTRIEKREPIIIALLTFGTIIKNNASYQLKIKMHYTYKDLFYELKALLNTCGLLKEIEFREATISSPYYYLYHVDAPGKKRLRIYKKQGMRNNTKTFKQVLKYLYSPLMFKYFAAKYGKIDIKENNILFKLDFNNEHFNNTSNELKLLQQWFKDVYQIHCYIVKNVLQFDEKNYALYMDMYWRNRNGETKKRITNCCEDNDACRKKEDIKRTCQ